VSEQDILRLARMQRNSENAVTNITLLVADYLDAVELLLANDGRAQSMMTRLTTHPARSTAPMFSVPMIGALVWQLSQVTGRPISELVGELREIGANAVDQLDGMLAEFLADQRQQRGL